MRRAEFDENVLKSFLYQAKIATLEELKKILGTEVAVTVFRKLKDLGYLSSYSHRGKYYTLEKIPRFDQKGLWSHRSVWFSKHGNLLDTIVALVNTSLAGYVASELEGVLHVVVNQPVLTLLERNLIAREKVSGLYLYCSSDPVLRKQQMAVREGQNQESGFRILGNEIIPDELKAAIILFFCLLNEKQKRLYAGLESMKLGHGGDSKIAGLLGVDTHTVAKGRTELFGEEVDLTRIRKDGGGRPTIEKKLRRSSKKLQS
jgi:hypothetical protein